MPMKLNVGISQKTGLPNYGSLGASCQIEVELDTGLVFHDPAAFQSSVREAYVACTQAVAEELARHRDAVQAAAGNGHGQHAAKAAALPAAAANPLTPAEPAGEDNVPAGLAVPATPRQMTFLRQLASQIRGLGLRRLEGAATQCCGKPLAALDSAEASQLIDTLKEIRAGSRELATLLTEEVA